jgi:hypothetical protein
VSSSLSMGGQGGKKTVDQIVVYTPGETRTLTLGR